MCCGWQVGRGMRNATWKQPDGHHGQDFGCRARIQPQHASRRVRLRYHVSSYMHSIEAISCELIIPAFDRGIFASIFVVYMHADRLTDRQMYIWYTHTHKISRQTNRRTIYWCYFTQVWRTGLQRYHPPDLPAVQERPTLFQSLLCEWQHLNPLFFFRIPFSGYASIHLSRDKKGT